MGNTAQAPIAPDRTFTLNAGAATLWAMYESPHIRPIYAARWSAFRQLLKERHLTITAAAELLGKQQGQVSHFGGKKPTKIIGDQIATEIEGAFGLPAGYLDERQHTVKNDGVGSGPPSQIQTFDAVILAEAEKWMRFLDKAAGETRPVRRAERLIAIYQLVAADGGNLSPEHAQELIEAARQGEANRGKSKAGRE